jgi:hypothetical protein
MANFSSWDKVKRNYKLMQKERGKNNEPDISLRCGLTLLGWQPKTAAQKALEFFYTEYDFGKEPEQVSFNQMFHPENEFFVTDPRGVFFLFKDLYKKFEDRIKLNKKVTEIKYDSSAVEVSVASFLGLKEESLGTRMLNKLYYHSYYFFRRFDWPKELQINNCLQIIVCSCALRCKAD